MRCAAALVGTVGGIAGVGGGSLLAPLLATSIVGVASFQILALIDGGGTLAPDWLLGVVSITIAVLYLADALG